jgi:hypothetical protein
MISHGFIAHPRSTSPHSNELDSLGVEHSKSLVTGIIVDKQANSLVTCVENKSVDINAHSAMGGLNTL